MGKRKVKRASFGVLGAQRFLSVGSALPVAEGWKRVGEKEIGEQEGGWEVTCEEVRVRKI